MNKRISLLICKHRLTKHYNIPEDKKTPKFILICTGNNHGVVTNTPHYYHQVLERNGVNHVWYTMDGDHNFVVWKKGLYNFVKRIFN